MSTTTERTELAAATVNSLVREHPQTVAVFFRFGMDTCCGGELPVRAAAERHRLDLAAVLDALEETIRG